jgi:predicted secreted Zn-dependent protease
VKKKNTPEAKAVFDVLLQIHHDEKRPTAAKEADISIEKHILKVRNFAKETRELMTALRKRLYVKTKFSKN